MKKAVLKNSVFENIYYLKCYYLFTTDLHFSVLF